jgi:hypothetical protein
MPQATRKYVEEALKQAPSLTILTFLVVYGVRASQHSQDRFLDALDLRSTEAVTRIEHCHDVQDRATLALDRNSEIFGRVAASLEHLEAAIIRLDAAK